MTILPALPVAPSPPMPAVAVPPRDTPYLRAHRSGALQSLSPVQDRLLAIISGYLLDAPVAAIDVDTLVTVIRRDMRDTQASAFAETTPSTLVRHARRLAARGHFALTEAGDDRGDNASRREWLLVSRTEHLAHLSEYVFAFARELFRPAYRSMDTTASGVAIRKHARRDGTCPNEPRDADTSGGTAA